MSRGREIELKLVLDEGGAEKLRAHPALEGVASKTARQVSTYFDTSDGLLRSAGFSLRVRESKGRFIQTIKQQGAQSAGMFDRPEWEGEVASPEPDLDLAARTPLGEHLGKKTRKRLKPWIRSEMSRTTWNVDTGGSTVEVVLDEGIVPGARRASRLPSSSWS
jgi:inorganic triphosphatase YgiF